MVSIGLVVRVVIGRGGQGEVRLCMAWSVEEWRSWRVAVRRGKAGRGTSRRSWSVVESSGKLRRGKSRRSRLVLVLSGMVGRVVAVAVWSGWVRDGSL